MSDARSDRIDYLITRRRPHPSTGINALMTGTYYDGHLAAIAGLAGTGDTDTYQQQRMQDLADQAYRWGNAALIAHTGDVPSPDTAVYYGGIRLSAYLSTFAVAAYCRHHPATSDDETLQEIITAFTTTLGAAKTDRDPMMRLGIRLHRHTTTWGYASTPNLHMLKALTLAGMANSTTERNAARGALAREILNRMNSGDAIKTAIRNAPLPDAAGSTN